MEVISLMLEARGLSSDKAISGPTAIELIQKRLEMMAVKSADMYTLIICDYSMPEMDGP